MNTEKLRELDKKFLDRVRRYLGVTMIDLETLENDLMYAVERLAAIIAEEEAEREALELREKLYALLLQVSRKYPGESRYETALRYLREHEQCGSESGASKTREGGDGC